MTDALKVGDRVIVIKKDSDFFNLKGVIEEAIETINGCYVFIVRFKHLTYLRHGKSFDALDLKKLPDEDEAVSENKKQGLEDSADGKLIDRGSFAQYAEEQKELKLEVGKPYIIPHLNGNPYVFIAAKSDFGFSNILEYIFIDADGFTITMTKESLKGIKEHREPYKKTIDAWIEYYPDGKPVDLIDNLTGVEVWSIYHTHEKAVGNKSDKNLIKKIRFTAEEIPD